MRTTTRLFGGVGIGTALVTAALVATLGGGGLAGGGIRVVGANPAIATSVPVSVVAQSTDTAGSTSSVTGATTGNNCAASALRLTVTLAPAPPEASGGGGGAATRSERLTLVFTNIASSPCDLRGYPNVDFLRAGAGGPLSEPDTFASTQDDATRVELAPGGAAVATATFVTDDPSNAQGFGCDDAVAVRAFLPGLSAAIYAGIQDAHGVPLRHFFVCGHGIVVSALLEA
jgi:hypothetical protein